MLTYINENFLHAPSTDLSREVIKFLVGVILAQATEVFWEKCRDEKKGSALVFKVASQAASMYTSLNEEVKEFMGKGIFDRNWITVLQVGTIIHVRIKLHYLTLSADQDQIFRLYHTIPSCVSRQCCGQIWRCPRSLSAC